MISTEAFFIKGEFPLDDVVGEELHIPGFTVPFVFFRRAFFTERDRAQIQRLEFCGAESRFTLRGGVRLCIGCGGDHAILGQL